MITCPRCENSDPAKILKESTSSNGISINKNGRPRDGLKLLFTYPYDTYQCLRCSKNWTD